MMEVLNITDLKNPETGNKKRIKNKIDFLGYPKGSLFWLDTQSNKIYADSYNKIGNELSIIYDTSKFETILTN